MRLPWNYLPGLARASASEQGKLEAALRRFRERLKQFFTLC
ncbi:MAG: hypothetical protein AVDCRST_MAG80-1706 [uncultured Rubrobacteraceae bacterium]|uniref:Uncharacterized protein n=1 Tax=uncultured Rubrobacteraceae bacterium TaxID=349277 RepID=A0A6J4QHW2_9ACTN|nr:MAG: hypothetical protein AVDCRST_MAG80-1706 [uncultured Rubrobacteraceae bacterium]